MSELVKYAADFKHMDNLAKIEAEKIAKANRD